VLQMNVAANAATESLAGAGALTTDLKLSAILNPVISTAGRNLFDARLVPLLRPERFLPAVEMTQWRMMPIVYFSISRF